MKSLDNYQKEAVYSKEKNILVVAAPGSGKTTVILNRIYYLMNEKNINSNNIIVITFTKAAAKSMKERYINLNKNLINNNKIPCFFGTIHGLFYKILKNYYGKIDIISQSVVYKFINNFLKEYLDEVSEEKIKEVINNISKFKVNDVSLNDFECDMNKELFENCYKSYEKYKKDNDLMDFDDLEIKCRDILLRNQSLLNSYRKIFKYILIDEFQDCDKIQIQILKLLCDGNSIFAVGDEDQCIYGFRGAEPNYMVDFSKNFKNGCKKYLKINYRSPKNIINISNNLISYNKMRNKKSAISLRESKNNIKILNSIDENSQTLKINNQIQKLVIFSSYKYSDIAILYRTNIESRSLIDGFIRYKTPFKLLDKSYNFFEHFICKDLIAYLKLSINNTDKESFLRIVNRPFRYISKIIINKIKDCSNVEDWFSYIKTFDMPIFQYKAIDQLKKDINYLNKISLDSAVNYIMVALGYNEYLNNYSQKFKVSIEDLENVVEEFKSSCCNFKNIVSFLEHIEDVKENIKKSDNDDKDSVILSTIHGVKGMEFKNVFIVNCNENNMPYSKNKVISDLEEERRLFYVAITRCIDNLWICTSENIRGIKLKQSRFIKECNLTQSIRDDAFKKGDKVFHKTFGKGEIIEFEKDYINIKFENGIKRKFDPIVLINSGLLTIIQN